MKCVCLWVDSSHPKDKANITNCSLAGAVHKASGYCFSACVFVVTSLNPHARLLQVAEGIDENVEDLEMRLKTWRTRLRTLERG